MTSLAGFYSVAGAWINRISLALPCPASIMPKHGSSTGFTHCGSRNDAPLRGSGSRCVSQICSWDSSLVIYGIYKAGFPEPFSFLVIVLLAEKNGPEVLRCASLKKNVQILVCYRRVCRSWPCRHYDHSSIPDDLQETGAPEKKWLPSLSRSLRRWRWRRHREVTERVFHNHPQDHWPRGIHHRIPSLACSVGCQYSTSRGITFHRELDYFRIMGMASQFSLQGRLLTVLRL